MHNHLSPSMHDLAARAVELGLSEKARERLTWIMHFLMHDKSITDTCAEFGISRSTFCRWLDRFNPDDLGALEEKSHEPIVPRQSALPAEIVEKIRAYRTASPLLGKEKISELLLAECGADVSPSTVGRIIERECLYFADTPLHWKKRMRMHGDEWLTISDLETPRNEKQQTDATSHHQCADAGCTFCRLARVDWRPIKRGVLVASLITNVAVIAMVVFSAVWESKVATDKFDATLLQSQEPVSFVSPHRE